MINLYPNFYMRHGIRFPNQLLKPVLSDLTTVELPQGSIYHCVEQGGESIGLTPEDIFIPKDNNPVLVSNVLHYTSAATDGNPRAITYPVGKLLQNYFTRFKRFKRLDQRFSLSSSPRVLVVKDYGSMHKCYRYTNNFYTHYWQWSNLYKTVIANVIECCEQFDRQQFLVLPPPAIIPPVSQLLQAATGRDRSYLTHYADASSYYLLDMWKWLGGDRPSSILSGVPENKLNKINLLWVVGSKWTTLNLGIINNWIKREGIDAGVYTPEMMQKRFLRFMMSFTMVSDEAPPESSHMDKTLDVINEVATGVKNAYALSKQIAPGGANMAALKASLTKVPTNVYQGITQLSEPLIGDDNLDSDLASLDELHEIRAKEEASFSGYVGYSPPAKDLSTAVTDIAEGYARRGVLSAAELRRIKALSLQYTKLKNPIDGTSTIKEFIEIPKALTTIEATTPLHASSSSLLDKSMLSSSLKHFDSRYIDKILHKDVVKTVMQLQKVGVCIQAYDVTRVQDYSDAFEVHVVKVVPVIGKPSTLRIRLPIVNEDGIFRCRSTDYKSRKQRGDVPIRKVAANTVALTSYYSKLFIKRSERATFSYAQWLLNGIVSSALDSSNTHIVDIKLSDCLDNNGETLPRVYTILQHRISQVQIGDYVLYLAAAQNKQLIPVTKESSKSGVYSLGYSSTLGRVLFIRNDSTLYSLDTITEAVTEEHGSIEDFSKLEKLKRPVDLAEMDVYGKAIPLGLAMGYHIGLGNLLHTLGVVPRRVKAGQHVNLSVDEFAVRFEDESLVFDRRDKYAMIFSGFNRYARDIKRYSVYHFDKPDIYGVILERNGLAIRYLREIDMMFKLWVDHITEELLIEMNEPTDLFGLLKRSVELLLTDAHPDAMDNAYMRDKGYERFSGILYGELMRAVKTFNARPMNANASVDLNPEAVWQKILQDQTVMPIEQSNPIHSLKENEVVVFRGSGGRSSRSLTAKYRVYHPNGMGVVSEATPDSGDVATITYLSADPNYTSVRGTTRRIGDVNGKASKLVSTSMLMAPAADKDSPQRSNFISIQNSQTTHCTGYTPMPTRTGYETVLPHRTEAMYAKTASDDGVVTLLNDKCLQVTYKSGDVVKYELGRRFGKKSGLIIPHQLETTLSLGQKVKQGDSLIHNSMYFTPDPITPSSVTYKAGVLARTVLWEATETLEDSCAISEGLANKLGMLATHVRNVKVRFDEDIRNLVKVGDTLDADSILCTIHPMHSGAGQDLFDDKALDTLRLVSTLNPRAKYAGKVEHIEVLYVGEPDEMSKTVKILADQSDSALHRLNKQLGKPSTDGQVDAEYRVDGVPMGTNTAVIRVYISGIEAMATGDKAVFANQMKTIVGRVLNGVNDSEDGKPIDAVFGYQSIADRIVRSAEIIGTTNSLMVRLGELALKAYDS